MAGACINFKLVPCNIKMENYHVVMNGRFEGRIRAVLVRWQVRDRVFEVVNTTVFEESTYKKILISDKLWLSSCRYTLPLEPTNKWPR